MLPYVTERFLAYPNNMLQNHLCSAENALSCDECLSCWMSLFVLGCRNGVTVVARAGVLIAWVSALNASVASLGAAISSSDAGWHNAELPVCSAANFCTVGLLFHESISKCPPDARAPLEAAFMQHVKSMMGAFAKAFNAGSYKTLIARVIELKVLERTADEDLSLSCGAVSILSQLTSFFPRVIADCDTDALFGGALTLLRTVCPKPLPAGALHKRARLRKTRAALCVHVYTQIETPRRKA